MKKTLNENDILALKKKVERYKTEMSELKGQHKALMKELQEDWECESVEEAEEKVTEFNQKIDTLEIRIKKSMQDIEEKYPELI